MKKMLLTALILATATFGAQATEISGALGATSQGGLTARAGVGFDWDKSWLESSTGKLTGYWILGTPTGKLVMRREGVIHSHLRQYSCMNLGRAMSSHSLKQALVWQCFRALLLAIRNSVHPSISRTGLVRV